MWCYVVTVSTHDTYSSHDAYSGLESKSELR